MAEFVHQPGRERNVVLSFRFGVGSRKICGMIELEVYAAGLRNIDKILELDHQLETIPGLRYKVDPNHDLVYLEMEEAGITLRELRAMFRKIGLEARFVGAVPDEMRSRSKTQPLHS